MGARRAGRAGSSITRTHRHVHEIKAIEPMAGMARRIFGFTWPTPAATAEPPNLR